MKEREKEKEGEDNGNNFLPSLHCSQLPGVVQQATAAVHLGQLS